MIADQTLLDKVAKKLGEPPSYDEERAPTSILTVAAEAYGFGANPPTEDVTQPTGFDPNAAVLFEAVVESAFLVANADGDFDDAERSAFSHLVTSACGEHVAERQIAALVADLGGQLEEDGLDKRIEMIARTVRREEHKQEVLRISGLIAKVSHGVSGEERAVMDKLSREFGLGAGAVEVVLKEVERALAE